MAGQNKGQDDIAKLLEYRLNGDSVVYIGTKSRQNEKENHTFFESVNIKMLNAKGAARSEFDPLLKKAFTMPK